MLINSDIKFITEIPSDITDGLVQELLKIDWQQPIFDRNELALSYGKLIEFPFKSAGKNKTSVTHRDIIKMADSLVSTVASIYSDHVFYRGEIACLSPGVIITMHKDRRWFHEHSHRIHIPLITNTDCYNLFLGRRYHFAKNTMYEINNRIFHSAVNNGTETRVHAIFDVMPNSHYELMIKNNINPNDITAN